VSSRLETKTAACSAQATVLEDRPGRLSTLLRFGGGVKHSNRAIKNLTEGGIVAPDEILPGGHPERAPMGPQARREYAAKMARRYRRADRRERGRLLDEFVAVTGLHRKYSIGLLGRREVRSSRRRGRPSRFGPEVVTALVALWRAMDYPWSCRLQAMLPLWLPAARRALPLSAQVEALLLGMSPRTMDRLLRPHRVALRRRRYGRTKPGTLLKHEVPIRSERWDVREAGWCEVDTVAHSGPSGEGEFISSVNVSDVASTWTETRAVLGKGKRHVVAALEEIRRDLPFVMLGIDSDSGSEFLNRTCIDWCKEHHLDFTRSRPYHKNDNAHVEQKNWTHVRKIFGWKRLDSHEAVRAMNDLYANELRLLLNYFQTNVKLVEKRRVGSRVTRRYDRATTPLDRLIALGFVGESQTAKLLEHRNSLDPFMLVAVIERKVAVILALPTAPTRPRRRGLQFAGPFSPQSAKREAAYKNASVRSYVAR
jgi:hypothetical protein